MTGRRKGTLNSKQAGTTGIEKSLTDKVQPFRVYYKGTLVWFAKTEAEAKRILEKEREKYASHCREG